MRGLLSGRTVAVVELPLRPTRSSCGATRYLQQTGYRIVPVDPLHAGEGMPDELYYVTFTKATTTLAAAGRHIDLTDIFRRSEQIPSVVQEAVTLGVNGIWVQLSIVNDEATAVTRNAGIPAVQDRYTKIEHQ